MYEECRHIKTSGTKCGSPALRGKAYCYFHFRAHQQRHRVVDRYASFMAHKFEAPLLEDRAAIQLAISEVVGAMAQNFMDPKRGGKILYGLQLALTGVKNPQEIVAPEPVRELCQNQEGEDIATEMTVYEEGEDFPDDEEDEGEDDDGQGENDRNREGDLSGISATASGNILSDQLRPKTLQEAIVAWISELKRRNPVVGRRERP